MRTAKVAVVLVVSAFSGGALAAGPAPDPCKGLEARVAPEVQTVAEATVIGGVRTRTRVELNGSPSKGDAFAWAQVEGPAVALGGDRAEKASFAAPDVGADGATLRFVLSVTQAGCGVTATAEAIVNVTNANAAPLAVAAASPEIVNEGETFTLDGSGSSDPDGDPLGYAWEQDEGGSWMPVSSDAVVALTAPEAPYPDGVTLRFRLTVTDGALTGADEQLVSVVWVNQRPSAAAACPEAVDERASVLLDGSGSSDDEDGIISWAWSQSAGGPVADLPEPDPSSPWALGFAAPSLSLGRGDAMTFRLTVTDLGGLSDSDACTVTVRDVTPPVLTVPAGITAEATSAAGAVVSWTASAHDAWDGDVAIACAPAPGSLFPLDETVEVTCSATDAAGNLGRASFGVRVVDTTPPAVTPPADVTTGPDRWDGAAVAFGGATAHDLVDGDVEASCAPASGATFPFGATVVTCSATDGHGNTGSATFTVTVLPFTSLGFFQPIDALPAVNTVRHGATVPVKWKLQGEGGLEIADVRAVAATAAQQVACGALGALEDPIELTATGGTVLRYDLTEAQFVFNWQTPRLPGTCWRLTVTFRDGATKSADFKLK